MKKVLKWCLKHKLLVLFLILIASMLMFTVKVVLVFTDSDEEAVYGSRLDGEKKITLKIDDSTSKVKEVAGDRAKGVTVRKQGRIIEIVITLNDDVSRDTAKDIANQAVSTFSDESKGYYDIQLFMNKENDDAQFPIVGYKHHTRDGITWTKDR